MDPSVGFKENRASNEKNLNPTKTNTSHPSSQQQSTRQRHQQQKESDMPPRQADLNKELNEVILDLMHKNEQLMVENAQLRAELLEAHTGNSQ